jgi:hypothetical protein
VWIVTTSALLVGLPLALSLEDESKIVAQEKEQYAQQYGAQQVRGSLSCTPANSLARQRGRVSLYRKLPACHTDNIFLSYVCRWQHPHPCTLPRQAPIRPSRRGSSLQVSDHLVCNTYSYPHPESVFPAFLCVSYDISSPSLLMHFTSIGALVCVHYGCKPAISHCSWGGLYPVKTRYYSHLFTANTDLYKEISSRTQNIRAKRRWERHAKCTITHESMANLSAISVLVNMICKHLFLISPRWLPTQTYRPRPFSPLSSSSFSHISFFKFDAQLTPNVVHTPTKCLH